MANQDLKENVLLNLRSVTQSCKGGVPFERLQRDYKDLLGSNIPFRELGYDSLEGFIRAIPHVIVLRRNSEGKLMATGVADSTTAHIVSLVSRQKTDTKKKPFRKPPSHFGMRRTLSSRYTFREGPRGAHSQYSPTDRSSSSRSYHPRPKTPPLKSPQAKPSKPPPPPPPPVQYSKPRVPPEQVPARKYEVAPRFLKLKEKEQKEYKTDSFSSSELISPTAPTTSSRSHPPPISFNNTEVIPPPRASYPVKPVENKHRIHYESLESAKTAKEFVDIYAKLHGVTPIYRTVCLGQKAKSKGFVSTLKLDDKTYQSYPEMRVTEVLAEEEAAKKAMAAIKERRGKYRKSDAVEYKNNTNKGLRRVSVLPDANLKIVIKC